MIIFYTNSISSKQDNQVIYDKIIQIIHSLGHSVTGPETHDYEDLIDLEKAKKNQKKMSIHNQFIQKTMESSDAVIIEASTDTFKLGQEAQMAIDKKIPVLCLSDNKDYSEKIQNRYLYGCKYSNEEDIKISIIQFLRNVESKHLSKRVGVLLHNEQLVFLDWYVKEKNIDSNKSRIIRESINEYMKQFQEEMNR